jgi:hypothetical protein
MSIWEGDREPEKRSGRDESISKDLYPDYIKNAYNLIVK